MIAALIRKLEREQYHEHEGRNDHDKGFRAGWNACTRNMLEYLRTEVGLAELRAFDVGEQP